MPETKRDAIARARNRGIPIRNVVRAKSGGYFIAPRGITRSRAKRAYAAMRSKGYSKEKAAKIAHSINKQS